MNNTKDITIKDVVYKAKIKNRTIDKNKIIKAYEYAVKMHKDQKRKSGEPYIIHPLNVAYILAGLGLDTTTICAALLHDVVEDTEATYEDIKERFGEDTAILVEGVTKLSKLFKTVEEAQAENYKKMFIAMEKDIRVIILKLADRLHNVRTLQYLRRDRQIAISKETIELYAPIAHKLGMYDMKMKLQDGAFKYLYPEDYGKVKKELEQSINENKMLLEKTRDRIMSELRRQRILANVKIGSKHLFSIYRKMKDKNINIDEIKDLFVIEIITKGKAECYRILGILNTIYSIMPGTFKDYIALPRNNMYQAIHEILLGEKGVMFEAKICSYTMNKIDKYGITNYFSYMMYDKVKKTENMFENNLSGIKDSLELEDLIENPKGFLETLKDEILDDEVYVFTPTGDIKVLPKGSTAIDFAYGIHQEIGDHIKRCIINSVPMPFITKLKNGDIVEIEVGKKETNVQEEWLKDVKTAKAKTRMVKLLNKNKQKEKGEKTFQILAKDRRNLVLEITNTFTKNKINIESLEADVNDEKARIRLTVEERTKIDLKQIIEKLQKIEDVKKVSLEE